MIRRLFLAAITVITTFGCAVHAQDFRPDTAPPLEELIAEALEHNPALRASRLNEAAAEQRISQMRSWMPPILKYQYNPQPIGTMEELRYMNMNVFSLSQMIPFPGKISARVDMEEAGYNMASSERGNDEVQIAAEVKKAYYELWMMQKKLEVNRELQSLLENFVQSAQRMYEVDMTGLEAVLSAQTNLAKLRTEERTIKNDYNKMLVMFNQLLYREPEMALGEIVSLPPEVIPSDLEGLERRMIARRPDIQAMRYGIEMDEADLRSARRDNFPDIMVELMYMQMPGAAKDRLGAMVSIQIPLAPWSSNMVNRRVSEARLNRQSREKSLENMISMARAEIRQSILDLETQLEIIRLYHEEVLPQTERTVESALGAFQAGRTEYLMVLDGFRMLEMFRMEYYMAVNEFHKSKTELEKQAGIIYTD
jgi:outer membrane protein, heavy metal efflux system